MTTSSDTSVCACGLGKPETREAVLSCLHCSKLDWDCGTSWRDMVRLLSRERIRLDLFLKHQLEALLKAWKVDVALPVPRGEKVVVSMPRNSDGVAWTVEIYWTTLRSTYNSRLYAVVWFPG